MPAHDQPHDHGPLDEPPVADTVEPAELAEPDEVDELEDVEGVVPVADAPDGVDELEAAADELDALPDGLDDEPLAVAGGSEVQRARKRYGMAGAVVAGAMFGLRDVLEPPKDDVVVTVEASSKPIDIDADGITVPVDGAVQAVAPALPPKALVKKPKRRRADRSRS